MGHTLDRCMNKVRCRLCFRLGHVKKGCTRSPPELKVWVPKGRTPATDLESRVIKQTPSDASSAQTMQRSSATPKDSPPLQIADSASSSPPPLHHHTRTWPTMSLIHGVFSWLVMTSSTLACIGCLALTSSRQDPHPDAMNPTLLGLSSDSHRLKMCLIFVSKSGTSSLKSFSFRYCPLKPGFKVLVCTRCKIQ